MSPNRIGDDRGFFSEVFRDDTFRRNAGDIAFVQDNHSFSSRKGTLRGLHCQLPPFPQGKLVRVTRGAIFDVAVDVRTGSPTYGRAVAVELSAQNWRQFWIPEGFLHGFCSLEDNTEVLYKVTNHYNAQCDRSIAWNDPEIGIDWPFPEDQLVISPKDRAAGALHSLPPVFALSTGGA